VRRHRDTHPYSSLKKGTRSSNGNGRIEAEEDDTEDDSEEEEQFAHDDGLSLHATKTATDASVLTVDRPKGQVWIPLVEEVVVLAVLGIQIALLVERSHTSRSLALAAQVFTWAYISVLTSLRLFFSASSRYSFNGLWYQTGFLYAVQWLCTIMVFRSEIIHPHSKLDEALISSYFALNTLLALIALTSRRGNRVVELEYEGDLEPSHEPLASYFSVLTFSWVDSMSGQATRRHLT